MHTEVQTDTDINIDTATNTDTEIDTNKYIQTTDADARQTPRVSVCGSGGGAGGGEEDAKLGRKVAILVVNHVLQQTGCNRQL